MYKTSHISSNERDEVAQFLDQQGSIANAWIMREMGFALIPDASKDWSLILCRHKGSLVGVANIFNRYREPDFDQQHYYEIRLEAVDHAALAALVKALPSGKPTLFRITNPHIQEYFSRLENTKQNAHYLYFSAQPENFRGVHHEGVIEIDRTKEDLFRGCDEQPSWKAFEYVATHEGTRMFAILREGKVAVHASTTPFSSDAVGIRKIRSIGGLYTEMKYRRIGLAAQLVSYITEVVFDYGDLPLYLTDPDNIASQRLAKKLGYQFCAQEMHYYTRFNCASSAK